MEDLAVILKIKVTQFAPHVERMEESVGFFVFFFEHIEAYFFGINRSVHNLSKGGSFTAEGVAMEDTVYISYSGFQSMNFAQLGVDATVRGILESIL